jgi:hypothetical protein
MEIGKKSRYHRMKIKGVAIPRQQRAVEAGGAGPELRAFSTLRKQRGHSQCNGGTL